MDAAAFKSWLAPLVDVPAFWSTRFPDWREGRPVRCPFHDDDKASLSLSPEGKGLCHACGWKCSWVGGFVESDRGWPIVRAMRHLRAAHVGDTVPSREWLPAHRALASAPELREVRERLKAERGIDKRVVEGRRLGWAGNRLIVPVFDEFGCCVNIRRHDALRLATGEKSLSYKKGFGTARIYPLDVLRDAPKVWLFEGEPDTLLGLELGLPAVTTTGGAKSWKDEWTPLFAGKKVVVCYDSDEPGQAGAAAVAKKLGGVAESVKVLRLTFSGEGKDLTDWIVGQGHTAAELLQLESSLQSPVTKNTPKFVTPAPADPVPMTLAEADSPAAVGVPSTVTALVAAADVQKYALPRTFEFRCREYEAHVLGGKIPKKCLGCWMPDAGLNGSGELPQDRTSLNLLDSTDKEVRASLCAAADVPAECDVVFDVKERHAVQKVVLVPDVPRVGEAQKYVSRTAYSFVPLEASRRYRLTGEATVHPLTQAGVSLVYAAKPARSDVDQFHMTPDLARDLESFAAPGDPYDQFMDLCARLSSVTSIVERPLLHAAVDLVFHSPLSFRFGRDRVNGWLDVMVVGDTRCGKGAVTEGLMRHYGVGAMVSGENVTVAGLVGGLESHDRKMVLRWGALPLQDRGLVALDEAGDMHEEVSSRMSRVRSEGIAEITKIGHDYKAAARVRLIWLCNPREGMMRDYTYGVQAVASVFPKAEDVARLDYALCVAASDVAGEVINTSRRRGSGAPDGALCRQLIHWAWSRTPEQVVFEPEAVSDILTVHSRELSGKYSPEIPLVQAQNIRIKLAKVSAALAARLFSHGDDPEVLVVRRAHSAAAARLLNDLYRAPATAYDAYSRRQRASAVLTGADQLDSMLRALGANGPELVRCLLSRRITNRAISAACRMDRTEADQAVVDVLLRCNAILERRDYYILTPAFKAYLEKAERDAEVAMEAESVPQ